VSAMVSWRWWAVNAVVMIMLAHSSIHDSVTHVGLFNIHIYTHTWVERMNEHTSCSCCRYGAWLFSTIVIFVLGLQAWFFAFFLIGWLLYYAWFNSVYYFAVLVFPWMQNALVRCRGNVRALTVWFVVYCVGIYLTCLALTAFYLFPRWKETDSLEVAQSWSANSQNIYALATMLFPPYV
jgi:hypothetical protein